jgi:hypothetical protein
MVKPILDYFHGVGSSDLVLRDSWQPSLGSYPANPSEGYTYIAVDSGTVSGVFFEVNDTIVYKDSAWVIVGKEISQWKVLTSATNLLSGERYQLDYDGGLFDVTLPASPSFGDEIVLMHIRGDVVYAVTYPRVLRNGKNIDSIGVDFDIDVNYQSMTFVYTGITAVGWSVKL